MRVALDLGLDDQPAEELVSDFAAQQCAASRVRRMRAKTESDLPIPILRTSVLIDNKECDYWYLISKNTTACLLRWFQSTCSTSAALLTIISTNVHIEFVTVCRWLFHVH
jgi:hypothetical protein